MTENIGNFFSSIEPVWVCVGLLFFISVQIERLGKAIDGLHKLIFSAHEDKIAENWRRKRDLL